MLNANKGTFASVITLTEVKIPKKYGINGKVTKRTAKQVQLAYNYESAVNRHLANEGKDKDFNALSLPWGAWVEGAENRVIEHKGAYYARMYDFKGNKLADDEYFVNGESASAEDVAIIKAYEASKTHSSRQGVSNGNEVRPTAVNFANIIYLKCGEEYYKDSTLAVVELPTAVVASK